MCSLTYKQYGSGQPLVILHGLLGSGDNWRGVAEGLAAHFDVYCLDLRNHGMSFHSDEMNYDVMAEDVIAFINDHHLFEPIILGHSMGGKVAIRVSEKIPEQLCQLVVVDISPRPYEDRHYFILQAMERLAVGDFSTIGEIDRVLSQDIVDPTIRGFILKNLVKGAGEFKWKVNVSALKDHYTYISGYPDLLNEIDVPALFIKGEKSDYITLEDERFIRGVFTDVDIQNVSNAGHWVHVEKKEEFILLLIRCLVE